MEAEILRLIVTSTAVVVAGLGGATLTAVINRKNTKDTLASAQLASKEQWDQTQQREHALWLRDQKLEAYTEFLAAANALRHDVARKPLVEKPNISVRDLNAKRLRVKVIGNPQVTQLATEIGSKLMFLIRAQKEALVAAKSHEISHTAQLADDHKRDLTLITQPVNSADLEVVILISRYVAAIRTDLGAATDDKAKTGARTKNNTAAV